MSEEKGRNNNVMFGGAPAQVPAGQPSMSIDEMLSDMLGETAHVLHDHEVPLPSKGIPYPVGHPLHGVEYVTIRAMRSGDEDILLNQALFKSGKMFTEFIRACLISPKCDPRDMLVGDRFAILVAIRISGYGAEATSELRCPSCDTKSKVTFNMNEFPIRYLDIPSAGDEKDRNLFELRLPISKARVLVRFQDGHIEEQDFKRAAAGGAPDKVSDLLKRAIYSVNGETDRMKIGFFCERMSPLDSDEIKKFLRDQEPKLLMERDWNCPTCGHSDTVRLPLQNALFRPDDN
jgi:rubredoxin